jgi:hypothetical protein
MPEIRLPDVRVPELRLPEMTRDDIARTLGDVRDDLVGFGRDIDLTRIDLPKAAADAAGAAGIGRARRVSRVPIVIGALVTMALVGWALLNSPSVKPRLRAAVQRAREQIESRTGGYDEAHAFDAAVPADIQANPWADDLPAVDNPLDGGSDLPEGFGADVEAKAVETVDAAGEAVEEVTKA